MLGTTEIIILVVVIGVLIFGAKKIPELAKTFGKAKGEFEKGKIKKSNLTSFQIFLQNHLKLYHNHF
jgi:sec-independent protein translocase protein TatA